MSFIGDVIHNWKLYKSGKANRSEVRYSASWRPDPHNGMDDLLPGKDGEYYKIVREAPAPPAKPEKQTERGVRNVLRRELGG